MRESVPSETVRGESPATAERADYGLERDGFSPAIFLSLLRRYDGTFELPLHFDAHTPLPKWPTQTHESEEMKASKYFTPEGLRWMFDYLDALEDAVPLEEKQDARERALHMVNLWRDTNYKEGDPEYDAFLDDEKVMSMMGDVLGRSYNPYHEQEGQVLQWARWLGDRSVLERMVAFARKCRRSTHHREMFAWVANGIDAPYAAELWLKELQDSSAIDPDKVQRYRRDVSRILYRLELGRIGISDEGVEYLGKRFDLGNYNSAENFVQRITPNGDIGVYNRDKVLEGTFNIGDLTDNEDVVRAQVLEITKDMLFTPRADETPEDRVLRERILQEFKEKHHAFYDAEFLEKTGVHINNLPLKEQGWFLHFVQSADDDTKARAYAFAKQHGENGIRTFLAAEYGDEVGDKILELGEVVEKDDVPKVQEIFHLYGTSLDNAEALRNKLQTQESASGKEGEQLRRLINQTYEALVRRSKDLTLAAHEIAVRKEKKTDLTLGHVQVALRGMNLLLELLHDLDGDGGYAIELTQTVREKDYTVLNYRVAGPDGYEYGLKLLARPEETRRPDGSVQAEARVNIELDFDTVRPHQILKGAFYTNTEFPEQKKCVERHTLRLGIDRDTHYEGGRVSLDLGRGDHVSDTLSRQGDVVGRLLQLVSDEGSHNTASFDQEFADPQVFKQLVNLLVERVAPSSQASPT